MIEMPSRPCWISSGPSIQVRFVILRRRASRDARHRFIALVDAPADAYAPGGATARVWPIECTFKSSSLHCEAWSASYEQSWYVCLPRPPTQRVGTLFAGACPLTLCWRAVVRLMQKWDLLQRRGGEGRRGGGHDGVLHERGPRV